MCYTQSTKITIRDTLARYLDIPAGQLAAEFRDNDGLTIAANLAIETIIDGATEAIGRVEEHGIDFSSFTLSKAASTAIAADVAAYVLEHSSRAFEAEVTVTFTRTIRLSIIARDESEAESIAGNWCQSVDLEDGMLYIHGIDGIEGVDADDLEENDVDITVTEA